MVTGTYTGKKRGPSWEISFSILRGKYLMPQDWVNLHGSRTRLPVHAYLVTKNDLIVQPDTALAALSNSSSVLTSTNAGNKSSEVVIIPDLNINGELAKNLTWQAPIWEFRF